MEYNIDNVNITDCVVYFVLQELTSQLVTTKSGQTPLHTACYSGSVDVVEILLDRGKLYQYVSLTQ